MNDQIIKYINYHPVRTQRGLEIISGLIPWLIIIFLFVGSFFVPNTVAYIVIAFNVYWLYRSIQFGIFAISGYLNIKATQKTDWMKRLKSNKKISQKLRKITHLVIIPTFTESIKILERNLDSLLSQDFPPKNIFVVLAMEERSGAEGKRNASYLTKKYRSKFAGIFATFHTLLPNETMGKHSNDTHAAKIAKKILVDQKKIPLDSIILTIEDADTVFPTQYFSLLTYKFLTAQTPYQKFFQAARFPFNNIHKVPLLVKLPSIITGISDLSMLQKFSKRFVISSVYSLSFKLLVSVNYWDPDFIPEDWHLYFKTYFQYSGKIEIVPLFVPIYIDAAQSTSKSKTLKNFYQQNKRWAWGIVDVPYVIKNFFLHPEIPFLEKILKISLALEFHFLWSSYWFLITLGATIPTIINPIFARTSLGFNLSRLSSLILTFCLFGLLTAIVINILLDPQNKSKKQIVTKLLHPFTYLQWIIMPIGGFIFGVLPGLESQTRLMLGKYLEYRVTEKV